MQLIRKLIHPIQKWKYMTNTKCNKITLRKESRRCALYLVEQMKTLATMELRYKAHPRLSLTHHALLSTISLYYAYLFALSSRFVLCDTFSNQRDRYTQRETENASSSPRLFFLFSFSSFSPLFFLFKAHFSNFFSNRFYCIFWWWHVQKPTEIALEDLAGWAELTGLSGGFRQLAGNIILWNFD